MKHTQAPHPPSSLDPAARLGAGWGPVYIFILLFLGDPIALLLKQLMALFEAFRAGTLPPPPVPLPRSPRPASAPRRRSASRRRNSSRRRQARTPSGILRAVAPLLRPSFPPPPWQYRPPPLDRPPKPNFF